MNLFWGILFSFLTVAALGGLLGLGLALASRLFTVKKDDRAARLEAVLPGLNCGACGHAGCAAYAEALISGASPALCSPGGAETSLKLKELLGIETGQEAAGNRQRMVTQVHCRGGAKSVRHLFTYQGLEDCNAAHLIYGGDKVCKSGCHGLGSCIKVCPVNAIDYDEHGLVWVDKDLCISCGKCVDICPTGVMRWVPYNADYIVACNSQDPAPVKRTYCAAGCIGCKLCEKKSPEGGFLVQDNLARLDYQKNGDRMAAAAACPPKCIVKNTPRPFAPKALITVKKTAEGGGGGS